MLALAKQLGARLIKADRLLRAPKVGNAKGEHQKVERLIRFGQLSSALVHFQPSKTWVGSGSSRHS